MKEHRSASRAAARLGLAVAVLVLAGAGPAFAHGQPEVEKPKANQRIGSAPQEVSITLTEAPTPDSKLRVKDGCGNDVATGVTVKDGALIATVAGGQPGRWRASYQMVSSVDGHPSEGKWSFTVAGKRDCDAGSNEQGPDTTLDEGPAADGEGSSANAAGPNGSSSDAGGGFPTIPVVLGAAGVVALAVVVRATASRG